MNAVRVNRRSLGITFSARGEAEVLLWAPYADTVSLVLISRQEEIPLDKQEFGYWSCITSRIKPGDHYLLELNKNERLPDPASLSQPEGTDGPSEVVNIHQFSWTDNHWENPALSAYIFYELHTGAFTPAGTFAGVEEKLDYLKDLGITAIEIMPVAQFPGTRNWGYDGVFPFAVQHSYGGACALQHLVNACHEKGLAVVLDVVYNHMGPEGNNFKKFGPYFTDKYKTPWGDAINVDDAGSDAVRKYILENTLMWFRDFHIDAVRLDAVHAINDLSPAHILSELKTHVDALSAQSGRKHYLIVECDLNDVRFIKGQDQGGYGMDAQWVDEFHHALRVTVGHERTGYYGDFDGLFHLAKSFQNGYVYDGMYSAHRDKNFGTKTTGIPRSKFIVFSQNHDHVGNRMLGERSSTLHTPGIQRIMAAAVMMSPFLPLLFMGEEYGEQNPFQYFISHSDEELVESVRQGRKKEFAAFHREGEVPDPQSEKTFDRSNLTWSHTAAQAEMLSYYKALVRLRKKHDLAGFQEQHITIDVDEEKQVLILRRRRDAEHIVCLFNFSRQHQSISFQEDSTWEITLNSSVEESNPPQQPLIQDGMINAHPESFYLLIQHHV